NLYTEEAGNAALPEKFARVPVAADVSAARPKFRWNIPLLAIIALLIIGGAIWFFSRQPAARSTNATPTTPASPTAAAPAASDKSIAVLPFDNLSSDKENAFFSQGIQDEIITTLSKISGLRVISRTSTAHYKSAPENLPEIARDLRVSNILEGSVQKAGDRVHINVQLIKAETDAHLWAQSYDRQLIDIFAVEAEVAKQIADALSTTLSPQEKARVETKPTANPDAYVLYLRGREYQTRPDNFLQDFRSAAQFFEQAIALDPNFALAHARLSAVTSQIYHWFEPTELLKQKAHAEAIEALRLQPNLGEGHSALGLYLSYDEADYEGALPELAPDSVNVKIQRGYVEFFAKGNTTSITAALESIPANVDPDGVVTFARWDVSLMDRDPAAAERALAVSRLEVITSQPGAPLPKSYLQGCIDLVRNDTARARTDFESARPALEKTVADSPQDATRHAQLGLLYAFMGRKEDALREGRRAVELRPVARDVIEGADAQAFQALIFARTGETDRAIS